MIGAFWQIKYTCVLISTSLPTFLVALFIQLSFHLAGEKETAEQRAVRLEQEAEARRAAAAQREQEAERKRREVRCVTVCGCSAYHNIVAMQHFSLQFSGSVC